MNDPADFRAWLKRQRHTCGLTQDDLGELVGYAGETIRKIEGGHRRPSPQLALRLATSRERLRLAGEWVLELEGLPVSPPLNRAQPDAALQLLSGPPGYWTPTTKYGVPTTRPCLRRSRSWPSRRRSWQ